MKKEPKGLFHVLGEKEKAEVFWTFPNKNDSHGIYEFEYQKNLLFWIAKASGFSHRDLLRIATVVAFLGERYRDENGNFDFRVSARNFVSGNKEPEVNHSLGVSILALALLDDGLRNKNLPIENRKLFKKLKKEKRIIVLAGMLHDFCEDKKGEEHCIQDLLEQIKIPEKEIRSILEVGQVLTRRRTKISRESSEDYILRVSQAENPVAPFLKGIDILHNALSPHKETQKVKYKSCYMEFVLELFPFVKLLLPDWVKQTIRKENKYLQTVITKRLLKESLPMGKKLTRKH